MPKGLDARVEEIREQPGVAPEVKAQQEVDAAESYGPDTRVGRSRATAVEQEDTHELSLDDLLVAAESFGTTPEMMAGALHLAGKTKMTRTEAKEALKQFLERRVN